MLRKTTAPRVGTHVWPGRQVGFKHSFVPLSRGFWASHPVLPEIGIFVCKWGNGRALREGGSAGSQGGLLPPLGWASTGSARSWPGPASTARTQLPTLPTWAQALCSPRPFTVES